MNSVISQPCKHTVTQGRDGETGSWCIECGVKVWEVHDRPCIECRHYGSTGVMSWPPTCTRTLMTITRTMHVYYAIGRPAKDGGLCFEKKEE